MAVSYYENSQFFDATNELYSVTLSLSSIGVLIERIQVNEQGQLLIRIINNANAIELIKRYEITMSIINEKKYQQINFLGHVVIWEY